MISARKHSQLDKSWADVFSNLTFIKNANSQSLSNIFLGGNIPSELYFPFVHEATHHWTYLSGVGSCMHLFLLRSYFGSKEINKDKESNKESASDAPWDVLSDYLRFDALNKFYEPLSEGLALFAEYDSYATNTEAIPLHLLKACFMFSGKNYAGANITIAEREKIYNRFLLGKRIYSDQALDRKVDLLTSSFDLEKSPYLIGYLTLKTIQAELIAISTKFLDSNLFMYCIREHFFNDPELIALVLDESIKDEHIAVSIANQFKKRMLQLSDLTQDDLQTMEREIVDNRPTTGLGPSVLDYTTNTAVLKMDAALADLYFDDNPLKVQEFNMRSFLRVTQLACYIRVDKHSVKVEARIPKSAQDKIDKGLLESGYYTQRGEYIDLLIARIPNEEGYPDYSGPATYQKYVSLIAFGQEVSLFTQDTKIYFSRFSNAFIEEEKSNILNFFETKSINSEEIIIELDAFFKQSSFAIRLIKEGMDNTMEGVKSLYAYLVAGRADQELDEAYSRISALEKSGFWDLLGLEVPHEEREEMINLLARISLCTSANITLTEDVLKFDGVTPEALEKLKLTLQKLNMPLLKMFGKYAIVIGA